jgi:glycosyltransferase involved in cell wall biosynthesis
MKPLVSIITPSYNQARFLEATLKSVLNQDYPFLEYIVVDGGSTDGSQRIIQDYADRLAWWVSEPDQGQADAINKGFKRASGEILAWLNSDDLYLPWTMTEAVDVFQEHPEAGVIYGDAISADAQGKPLNELRFGQWSAGDLLQFKMICQPAVFMRRTALERVGFLDSSFHFLLDHQLWIRLARENILLHHPRIWAVSRYHSEAKNLRLASLCGEEVTRILEWAESQEDLAGLIEENRGQVMAGAYQLTARYLLDSGEPAQAFRYYSMAAASWLPSLRGYWHRLLFSALSTLGLGFLGKWYYSLKGRRRLEVLNDSRLADWPGIRAG